MLGKIPLLLISICSLSLRGQVLQEAPINIGSSINYHSSILDEDRTILVHNPNDYIDSSEHQDYPTIYVLDGHDHFRYLVGMLHRMGNDFLPKMNVVGITQNDRDKDLKPNGYSDFISYLGEEVIPLIDSNYRTTGERILVGHSWGGMFTLTTFIENNSLFDNYLVIDPYIVGQEVSAKYKLARKKEKFNNAIYISVARTFPDTITVNQFRQDTSRYTEMARETYKLIGELKKDSASLNFKYDYYDNESHMSVPNISIYKGLKFMYRGYIRKED